MTTEQKVVHRVAVTIELSLTEEFLSDILIGAFDGGCGACWYWAQPYRKEGDAFTVDGEIWRSVKIVEKEAATGDKRKWCVMDHERLIRGIKKLFEPGVLPKRDDVRNAIVQSDGGMLDAEGFDIIVQLALFGELVYG